MMYWPGSLLSRPLRIAENWAGKARACELLFLKKGKTRNSSGEQQGKEKIAFLLLLQ